MYKCNDCGETFESHRITQTYIGEFWGDSTWKTIYVCPFCGSEDTEDFDDEYDTDNEEEEY